MNNNISSSLILQVRRNNPENRFSFKGFERLSEETFRLIETEVVDHELQSLLLNVVKNRNYNTNEIQGLIGMIRKFDTRVRRKIVKLIVQSKLHIEILPSLLKKLHAEFDHKTQLRILKVLKL